MKNWHRRDFRVFAWAVITGALLALHRAIQKLWPMIGLVHGSWTGTYCGQNRERSVGKVAALTPVGVCNSYVKGDNHEEEISNVGTRYCVCHASS